MLPNLLENALPIYHVLKVVFYFVRLGNYVPDFLCFKVGLKFLNVWNQKRCKLAFTGLLLRIIKQVRFAIELRHFFGTKFFNFTVPDCMEAALSPAVS